MSKVKKIVNITENALVDMIDVIVQEAITEAKTQWINEQAEKGNKTPLLEQKLETLTAQVQKLMKK